MIRGPKTRAEAEGWEYQRDFLNTEARWWPRDCAWELPSGYQCRHGQGHGPEGLWCKKDAMMAEATE
jgi:hypothetical protein